jgi:hypothetical protein
VINEKVFFGQPFFIFISILFSIGAAESTTILKGTVIDFGSASVVAGASVSIEGATISTETDILGNFILLDAPTGNQNLVVTSIGYNIASIPITLEEKRSNVQNKKCCFG